MEGQWKSLGNELNFKALQKPVDKLKRNNNSSLYKHCLSGKPWKGHWK